MKVTQNWLKQYVDFNWTPEEMTERLTMLGVEVEGVQKITGDFDGIVVGHILASEKHPNADKLSVCKVADGKGERQIVCGAKNFVVGDKVPLALPGTTMPQAPGAQPFTIKVGKLRGVESQGMLCSAKELLISEDAEGLMILPADAQVGQPLAEHLGRSAGDVVYDLEVTPNRPDWNSVMGIAREIAALTGQTLRVPQLSLPAETGKAASEWVDVRIEAPVLCPRYTARVATEVKVGPSPAWLRQRLESVGLRSINNVVDITNFVMLETGQPLHAFDYRLLEAATGAVKPAIVVRTAHAEEKLTTLDNQVRALMPEMLLIADEKKGVALAGIMGGLNSEIRNETTEVLIESATFKAQNIRATSKRLELRTDASYRFERGADLEMADWASRRAAALLVELAGAKLAPGAVDIYPGKTAAGQLALRFKRVEEVLGIAVPTPEIIGYLQRLGLRIVEQTEAGCTVEIPSHRLDLKREIDLIEEVARLYGVNRIPSSAPHGVVGTNEFDAIFDELTQARRLLAAMGLNEIQSQTLVSAGAARQVVENIGAAGNELVLLENPLSSDMDALRPSLITGALACLSHNARHKTHDAAVFEIGRVFVHENGKRVERRKLALALTGARSLAFWEQDGGARYDVFDLKGILEEFFEQYGLRGLQVIQGGTNPLFVEQARLVLGKKEIGVMGQIQPAVARHYDVRDPVLVAELDMDLLLAFRNASRSVKPLPVFPAVKRDIAMLVSEAITHDQVVEAVKKQKPRFLETVEVFDIFRGKGIAEGQKSIAYSLTYRNPEKTLTDTEVNAVHDQVVTGLKTALGATIREG